MWWLLFAGAYALINWLAGTTLSHSPWWLLQPFTFWSLQIRWAGRNPAVREYMQTYGGFKFNGFFSVVFRVQSDESAAAGFTSRNYGQAIGWEDGGK